jgi:pimeloyl-ACP methyl ester carboxylesterase
MDALGIARAGLIGHSMGGAIALEATARLNDRVTSLALLGTAAAVPVNEQLLSAARDHPQDAYQMMTAWALRPTAKIGRNPAPGMWMTRATLALFDRNTPGILHRDLALCDDWSTGPEAAKRVTCPTLVVTGKQDVMTPPRNGEKLAQAVAGSTTITLDNCGHMMMSEAPDALLDALKGFFVPRLSR